MENKQIFLLNNVVSYLNREYFSYTSFSCQMSPLSLKSRSKNRDRKSRKIRKKFSDLEKNVFFYLIVGNKQKFLLNNVVSYLNREYFSYTSFSCQMSPLNRKSRSKIAIDNRDFSRSEIFFKKSETSKYFWELS